MTYVRASGRQLKHLICLPMHCVVSPYILTLHVMFYLNFQDNSDDV